MLQETTVHGSPPVQSGKIRTLRWAMVAIAALIAAGGTATYAHWRSQTASSAQQTVVPLVEAKTVTALGELQPSGEVIKLSAPASSNGSRVEQLLVQEGDAVKAGQVIAVLDTRDRLQAAYQSATEQVRVAQAKLAITQAGAKRGEINAQRAEIARLEAERQGQIDAQSATLARLDSELRNAQTEYQRYQSLYQQGAISASQRDSKQLTLETAQKSLQEAQATLNRVRSTTPAQVDQARATLDKIAEVRPVDVRSDQAAVDQAIAAANQAKAELDQAYVKAPQAGVIMKIYARPGEVVSSSDGIVDLGQTRQMDAVAEVYQSDVTKVKVGQIATVTSDSLPGTLRGKVERIGWQVQRQQVVNTDPSSNIDARVVEVHIALDAASSQKAAKFTHLQVQVAIAQ